MINRGEQCIHANPACKAPPGPQCDVNLDKIYCSQNMLTTTKGCVDVKNPMLPSGVKNVASLVGSCQAG